MTNILKYKFLIYVLITAMPVINSYAPQDILPKVEGEQNCSIGSYNVSSSFSLFERMSLEELLHNQRAISASTDELSSAIKATLLSIEQAIDRRIDPVSEYKMNLIRAGLSLEDAIKLTETYEDLTMSPAQKLAKDIDKLKKIGVDQKEIDLFSAILAFHVAANQDIAGQINEVVANERIEYRRLLEAKDNATKTDEDSDVTEPVKSFQEIKKNLLFHVRIQEKFADLEDQVSECGFQKKMQEMKVLLGQKEQELGKKTSDLAQKEKELTQALAGFTQQLKAAVDEAAKFKGEQARTAQQLKNTEKANAQLNLNLTNAKFKLKDAENAKIQQQAQEKKLQEMSEENARLLEACSKEESKNSSLQSTCWNLQNRLKTQESTEQGRKLEEALLANIIQAEQLAENRLEIGQLKGLLEVQKAMDKVNRNFASPSKSPARGLENISEGEKILKDQLKLAHLKNQVLQNLLANNEQASPDAKIPR